MITVNSLSGGKTSSYLAVHYPADYDIFSLVCIDDKNSAPKDKLLVKKVNDKLQKYCAHLPEFIATPEDDKILRVMFDLEQMLGREIIWLRGNSFDQVIDSKKAVPNQMWRFCTTHMKINVIFEFWHNYIAPEKVAMRVGFRYDELDRAKNFTTEMKYPYQCSLTGSKRQKWKTYDWRVGEFPLIEDRIIVSKVRDFWHGKNIQFAEDSNCLGCFWKSPQQIRMNYQNHPNKMQWFSQQEDKIGKSFKKGLLYKDIFQREVDQGWLYGEGSSCQAGFCTD